MARHAAPPLDRPRRTYFDLLDQKYPELARPRRRLVGRGVAVRASSSRWPWMFLALALGALLVAGWPFLPGQSSAGSNGVALAEAEGWGRLELVPWRPAEGTLTNIERLALAAPSDGVVLEAGAPDLGERTGVDAEVTAGVGPEISPEAPAAPGPALDSATPSLADAGLDLAATVPETTAPETTVPAAPVPSPSADLIGTESLAASSIPPSGSATIDLAASPQTPTRPDVAPGLRLFAPAPEYPEVTWQAGLVGRVRLEAEVDVEGRVVATRVVEGVAPELDDAAVAALETWRFEPAIRNGEPHAYRYRVAFDFRPPIDAPEASPSVSTNTNTEPSPSAVSTQQQAPVRLVSPMPAYPEEAWVRGVEGEVLLRASIDTEGRVTGLEVLRGLPYGLTEAALEAVSGWRFRPAQRSGRPIAVEHDLRLRFQL